MATTPEASPRRGKITLCIGQHCNRGGRAEPLYDWLATRLGERKPPWAADDRPITWGIKNCLNQCDHGPNLLVQPAGRICHHLTLATLAEIVEALADGVDLSHGMG